MTSVLEPPAIAAAATAEFIDALVAELADRTADVAGAALTLIDTAESGHLVRVMSAAAALRSELDMLLGSLGPSARAGLIVDPAAVAPALQARLTTTIWIADLDRTQLP
ncbi:hypothetical protein ACQP0C_41750 (plasmid) [Nocardia sp. CA-129566]|uniref:hypothetical protein n=1 Tax=Nocardia sp. CA-129566 TaxID=3239976 RepID=UPI003D98CF39